MLISFKVWGKVTWFMKALKDAVHIASVSNILDTSVKLWSWLKLAVAITILLQLILPIFSLLHLLFAKALLLWRKWFNFLNSFCNFFENWFACDLFYQILFLIEEKNVNFIKNLFHFWSRKWVSKDWSLAIIKSYSNSTIKYLLPLILTENSKWLLL